jgi:hypothetical protein
VPTRIVHGLDDERVSWGVSTDFAAAARPSVVDVTLLSGCDHRMTARLADVARLVRESLSPPRP